MRTTVVEASMYRSIHFASLFPLLLVAACGADDGSEPDDTGPLVSEYAPGIADPCVNRPDSIYPNDDLCLEPPPEDMGTQIYYGPGAPGQAVDYDDPEALAPFIIQPGGTSGDIVQCQYRTLPNAELKYTSEYHTRARTGTHHVIFWTSQVEGAPLHPDGALTPECRELLMNGYGFVPGAQSGFGDEGARLDIPLDQVEVPENEGHARQLVPHANVGIETHYLNMTDEPVLAEVWANLIYKPENEVKNIVFPMFLIGGLETKVPPGGRQIVGVDGVTAPQAAPNKEIRLMGFGAHSHAHTNRVSAWINRAGSTSREYVYETYDWSEPLMPQFDSGHTYLAVKQAEGVDGAHSGILTMAPGDTFGWECEIHNDDSNVTLIWGDGAYEKEMCNIFGYFSNGKGQWNYILPPE